MNPIAKRIQEARLKAKMTEKELGKKCGLDASYIKQIETGKKIINEKAAESILAVFGERMEVDFSSPAEEEVPAPKLEKKKEAPKPTLIDIEPNDQWAGALANIIKRFSIVELPSGKAVGEKELPVLSKKVEGMPWEKLMFVRTTETDLQELRIGKDDTLWIQQAKDFQGKGIYLIEWKNKKLIRYVHKNNDKVTLSKGPSDSAPVTVALQEVRPLGRCVRIEINLM